MKERTVNQYKTLTVEEINDTLIKTITEIVDDYFLDQPLAQGDLLDRVEAHLFRDGIVLPGSMEDPVCRRIMAVAKKAKKEASK